MGNTTSGHGPLSTGAGSGPPASAHAPGRTPQGRVTLDERFVAVTADRGAVDAAAWRVAERVVAAEVVAACRAATAALAVELPDAHITVSFDGLPVDWLSGAPVRVVV